MNSRSAMEPQGSQLELVARAGLWALPVWAALLLVVLPGITAV